MAEVIHNPVTLRDLSVMADLSALVHGRKRLVHVIVIHVPSVFMELWRPRYRGLS